MYNYSKKLYKSIVKGKIITEYYANMYRDVTGKRKTHKGWTGVVINKEKEVQL